MFKKITGFVDWLTAPAQVVLKQQMGTPTRLPNGLKTNLKTPQQQTPQQPEKKLRDYPDDETLRANHLAVKDAWEQYQMLIKLHGGLTQEQRDKIRSKNRRPMKK